MTVQQLTPAQGLVVRAGMYQLLAVGYAYPSPGSRQRADDLGTALETWISLLRSAWADRVHGLRAALGAADPAELEAEFNRLFSGGMACAPHETAYEPDIFRKQHALADIAGFYRAFGFRLPDGSRWSLDHVGVQLEFCAILLQRMAAALEEGGQEQAAVCDDALRKFLADHLGRWSQAFTESLEQAGRVHAYQELARVTREWVEAELAALGLEPDRLTARKTYAGDLDLPVCGACTDCGPAGPTGPCPAPPRQA